jgi:hypothetical protein
MTTIDPVDNITFWHTNEYYPVTSSASWFTRVGKFQFPAASPTPAPTPAAPRALKATNVTATSFTANWSTVTGATGYRLDVATDSSFTNYVLGYRDQDVGNMTSTNVTGLAARTTYYYRVRAYNGNGTSPSSNVVQVKTRNR